MALYNKAMQQIGLHVRIDQDAYPHTFDGPRGHLVKGLTGIVTEVGEGEPGSMWYGLVKIKFDPEMAGRVRLLGWKEDEEHWFLSGALSRIIKE